MGHDIPFNRRLGDDLIDRISLGTSDEATANELLTECYRGYPIENLRRLLRSEQESAVKAGMWVVSELGESALPLFNEVAHLLTHTSRYVRFFALDAVLLMASSTDGKLIADAIQLVKDPDEAVRWKAMQFLARSTPAQLRAGVAYLLDVGLAGNVNWLLRVISETRDQDIIKVIDSENHTARLFGAVAAARLIPRTTIPLRHAASSSNYEVSSFAHEFLKNQE